MALFHFFRRRFVGLFFDGDAPPPPTDKGIQDENSVFITDENGQTIGDEND